MFFNLFEGWLLWRYNERISVKIPCKRRMKLWRRNSGGSLEKLSSFSKSPERIFSVCGFELLFEKMWIPRISDTPMIKCKYETHPSQGCWESGLFNPVFTRSGLADLTASFFSPLPSSLHPSLHLYNQPCLKKVNCKQYFGPQSNDLAPLQSHPMVLDRNTKEGSRYSRIC